MQTTTNLLRISNATMAKGRWSRSEENVAIEAYSVLMAYQKPNRTLTKADLLSALAQPNIYQDFLKLALEHDTSKDLAHFRKGLLLVVKSVGLTSVAQQIGLSRLSLYRMLGKGGNPRLGSLLSLFKALGVHLWLVDNDFKKARSRIVRPKDVPSAFALPKDIRRPGHAPEPLRSNSKTDS